MTETHSADQDLQDDIYPGDAEAAPRDAVVPDGLTSNKADDQTPGEILREARLAREYTVEELCGLTMLSRRTVEALEDNRFETLPQPVFVRGYYRKCAKILDIDGDRLLQAYAASGGAYAVTTTSTAAGGPIRVVPADVTPARRRSFGFVLLILILIVVGLAGYLYWSGNFRADTNTTATSGISLMDDFASSGTSAGTTESNNIIDLAPAGTAADDAGPGPSDAAAMPSDSGTLVPEQIAASAPGAAATDEPRTATQPAADSTRPTSATANATASTQTSNNDMVAAEQPVVGDNASETTTAAGAGPAADADAAAATGTALTIQFGARSWIDVHDATGAQLLVGIYEQTSRTVDGVPPYELVIGYAPGVSVRYQGQAVPFESAGNATARFSVGSGDG